MYFKVTHLRHYRRSLLVARAAYSPAGCAGAPTTATMAPQQKNRVFVIGVGMTKVKLMFEVHSFHPTDSSGPSLKFCL